ncbi:MAG: ATP-binding protein [Acidobacteriota bacterium]
MKLKIIIGLSVFAVVFLLACVYLLRIVNDSTAKLDNVVMLHQIEILRERYLLRINRAQMSLALSETGQSQAPETAAEHAREMHHAIESCFDCHHTATVQAKLTELKERTEAFEAAILRALLRQSESALGLVERRTAFEIGEDLSTRVSDMIASTGANLESQRKQASEEVAAERTVLYLLVIGIPIITVVLGVIFIKGHTRPLYTLMESTRRLKAGELDHRVTGLTHEVGELATAFNEMASSLQEQVTKMQRAEQLAVLGELAAGFAHEIKNPMAGIKVAMEVLSKEANLTGEDKLTIEKVVAEIAHLETLMKEFLNFAKPPRPQPAELDINASLDSTLAFYLRSSLGRRDPGKAIEIVKQFGALPHAVADPHQLEQVLLNLMINAVDAMPDGGTLTVRTGAASGGESIEIAIIDTGKGIDKHFAGKIFQPFFTTKRGGTGLGLAISRQLIEQNDGTLTVADNPTGGSIFTVRLPARSADKGNAA